MSALEIVILGVVFLLLFITGSMLFFAYLAKKYHERARDKKLKEIEESSFIRSKKPPPRTNRNDHRSRDKVAEKKRQQEVESGIVQYYSPEQQLSESQQKGGDVQIVGLAEPKGFWSKFVMNQKIGYIMARANFQNRNQSGFWVNLIKAKAISQGKDQGRGR